MRRPLAHVESSDVSTVLKDITSIGRFQPRVFYPSRQSKPESEEPEDAIQFNAEGLNLMQRRTSRVQRSINTVEFDIKTLRTALDRHHAYMEQVHRDHENQIAIMQQQIENRKAQIAKIDNSQEPPTMNQIAALVRQIQVEGMAAKRRAENCLRDQDVNLVLSGERLRKFHEFLGPSETDTVLQAHPELRSAYDRMEEAVYRTAETQTRLRSLKIYNTNLEQKLVELSSALEALQFDKGDVQMGIVDKKEELHAELMKRSEELGRLKWKIEYLKSLKTEMKAPRFDVRD